MSLPKEINPSPLIFSTVEIRFESQIQYEETLNVFFPFFSKDFPKMKEIPKISKEEKEKNPSLKFHADYTLTNDNYSISFTPNSISFENVGGYHLWENYFPVIKSALNQLPNISKVGEIKRVGLRYINVFNSSDNSISNILNVGVNNIDGLSQDIQALSTITKKDNVNLHLQVAKNVGIRIGDAPEKEEIRGIYVDIDASCDINLPKKIDEELFKLINTLHDSLKEFLFKRVVKKDYLGSLNIKY